jgi:hypothetical protein
MTVQTEDAADLASMRLEPGAATNAKHDRERFGPLISEFEGPLVALADLVRWVEAMEPLPLRVACSGVLETLAMRKPVDGERPLSFADFDRVPFSDPRWAPALSGDQFRLFLTQPGLYAIHVDETMQWRDAEAVPCSEDGNVPPGWNAPRLGGRWMTRSESRGASGALALLREKWEGISAAWELDAEPLVWGGQLAITRTDAQQTFGFGDLGKLPLPNPATVTPAAHVSSIAALRVTDDSAPIVNSALRTLLQKLGLEHEALPQSVDQAFQDDGMPNASLLVELHAALERAGRKVTTGALASALGVSADTIERRMKKAGWVGRSKPLASLENIWKSKGSTKRVQALKR